MNANVHHMTLSDVQAIIDHACGFLAQDARANVARGKFIAHLSRLSGLSADVIEEMILVSW